MATNPFVYHGFIQSNNILYGYTFNEFSDTSLSLLLITLVIIGLTRLLDLLLGLMKRTYFSVASALSQTTRYLKNLIRTTTPKDSE